MDSSELEHVPVETPTSPAALVAPSARTTVVAVPAHQAAHGAAPGPHKAAGHGHHQSYWIWVMCLTGVDYFSTLGYQPSIAFGAAGMLAPLATVVLVFLTLFGALPVYAYVASHSPPGQGSIHMLEYLVRGWAGKFLVLTLLGFAATDFVITKTLSAADAAEHLIHNPYWADVPEFIHQFSPHQQQLVVTMLLLVLLGAAFMRGMTEVIGLAVVIVATYLVLNIIVIGYGLHYLSIHPDKLQIWLDHVRTGDWHIEEQILSGHDTWTMIAICLLIFPKLALGLSGFETGVAVMPLILGRADDDPAHPRGRIRNARKLLITSALIMSVLLLGSSLVTSTLIPPEALMHGGPAANRALAYLAHGQTGEPISPLFGDVLGTIYDASTVIILWFAGASAMAGLLNLVPQYLPRYGMAPEWARAIRPLVLMFTAINLVVTWIFKADVAAQGGAYATGVLVLITSACVATVISKTRENGRVPKRYVAITIVFVYTTGANMFERPDGLKIASCFIAAIVCSSIVSRVARSREMRFTGFEFANQQSRFLWDSLRHLEFPVLVPHRPGRNDLDTKEETIRQLHRLSAEVPIVFVEAELGDPSEFEQTPVVDIHESQGRIVLAVKRCSSIAHVIAAIALELSRTGKPPEIHFGWSDEGPIAAVFAFLIFGQGNIPAMVRHLILRAEPDSERQPRVVVG